MDKIPQITLFFWLMKIVATTMGEMFGDYLSMSLNLGYRVSFGITASLFLLAMFFYSKVVKGYNALLFWLLIIFTTTVGTEISDMIDRTFHLGYLKGSLLLFLGLFIVLSLWYAKYRNLHIHPMNDPFKEYLFWTAVLFSNSLGTAFGDFLTDNMGLHFLRASMLTLTIIGITALLHFLIKGYDDFLFWIAFIFTRPFGATFGDFLTKPNGGLGLDRLSASLTALAIFVLLLSIEHIIFLRRKNETSV